MPKYIHDLNQLMPYDILLNTTDDKISGIIRKNTGGDYSHAALYLGGGEYIDATGDGVHSGNIQRLLRDYEDQLCVLRLTRALNDNESILIEEFIRTEIGKPYSIPLAIKTKIKPHFFKVKSRQFCSRLVAQAYHYANIKLVENCDYCSPNDIFRSTQLKNIKECVVIATEQQIDFAQSTDPRKNRVISTNIILKTINESSYYAVNDLSEIMPYLLKHPEHDDLVCNAFEGTDYLELYMYEKEKNFYRTSTDKFIDHYLEYGFEAVTAAANQEVVIAYDLMERFHRELYVYQQLATNILPHKLRYLAIMVKLYSELVNHCATWIKSCGSLSTLEDAQSRIYYANLNLSNLSANKTGKLVKTSY